MSRFRCAVVIDGQTRLVELGDVQADGKLRMVIDGREQLADVRDLGHGVWSVLDGTEARLLQVDGGTAAKLTVEVSHPDGEPRICVAAVSHEWGPAAHSQKVELGVHDAAAGPVTLRAPIPGRLIKVLVRAAERVTAGQTLLVLEAMKMENELRAPRAGIVSAVHAVEGVAVETGQDLVSLD